MNPVRNNQGAVSETESIAMDIIGLLDDEQRSDKPMEETLHKIHFWTDNLLKGFGSPECILVRRIVTAPKGHRGILSYIDFIEDVTTKKTSATVDDFDALIGTVVGT